MVQNENSSRSVEPVLPLNSGSQLGMRGDDVISKQQLGIVFVQIQEKSENSVNRILEYAQSINIFID